MTTFLLGIAASLAAEGVSFLNKKLIGTPFKGTGSFIMAGGIAFLVASVKFTLIDHSASLSDLPATFTGIFTMSQAWFYIVAKNLNLEVKADYPAEPLA